MGFSLDVDALFIARLNARNLQMRCQLRSSRFGLIVISFATEIAPHLLGCVKSGGGLLAAGDGAGLDGHVGSLNRGWVNDTTAARHLRDVGVRVPSVPCYRRRRGLLVNPDSLVGVERYISSHPRASSIEGSHGAYS